TFSTYIQLHSFLDTSRNIDAYSFFTIYSSLAFTYRTFGCDGRSFAITGWTGSDGLHLSEERILHSSYLAAATTGSTGLNASFVLCATPIAGVASDVFFYF